MGTNGRPNSGLILEAAPAAPEPIHIVTAVRPGPTPGMTTTIGQEVRDGRVWVVLNQCSTNGTHVSYYEPAQAVQVADALRAVGEAGQLIMAS